MVSSLHYSSRLLELPLGIIGISIATIGLPLLSVHAANSQWNDFQQTLEKLFKHLIFLLTPILFLSLLYSDLIIQLLFEGGRFDQKAVALTTVCFVFHLIGLPFIATARILGAALIAVKQTKALLQIAILSIVVNLALALLLTKTAFHEVFDMPAAGLALAGSATAFTSTLFSAILLYKKLAHTKRPDKKKRPSVTKNKLLSQGIRTFVAAAICLLALMLLQNGLRDLLSAARKMTEIKGVLFEKGFLLLEFGGGTVFFLVLYVGILYLFKDPVLYAFWNKNKH